MRVGQNYSHLGQNLAPQISKIGQHFIELFKTINLSRFF